MKILDAMQDIYYGRVASPWALDVDDWSIDPNQVKLIICDRHQICIIQLLRRKFCYFELELLKVVANV